ncbi:hypothetical protein B296_00036018 [Ensete ventricosum]|uniref:Uncharacterized protein n=1 Tax=Ensete ventricosum TaxID=4639 RepID=A0A426ZM94_ENSVE|nr:hypothetical protein B296_00036018 [Ensete ventricosum]
MKLALKGHLGIWCHSLPLRMLVVIDLKCFPLVSARSEFNGEVLVLSSCDLFDSTSCSASSSIMEQGGPYTDLQNCSGMGQRDTSQSSGWKGLGCFPRRPSQGLDDAYFKITMPVVAKRIAQGGVRLAMTLNRVFGEHNQALPSPF